MGGFIEPNIHPVLVHFTFALGVSAAFAYLGAMLVPQERWRTSLRPAADWMLALAAIAVVATIAAGFEAYYTVAHDTPSHEAMTTHRNWAVPSGLALLGLAGWRWIRREEAPGILFTLATLLVAGLLTVTAWWGGTIVYKHGLGVQSLPAASGPGHNHDHGDGAGHGSQESGAKSESHEETQGHETDNMHDASGDGQEHEQELDHHSEGAEDSGTVPAGHDDSDGHHDPEPVSVDEQRIRDILSAVDNGWENGDGAPFRTHFLDWSGARYFESGGENTGRQDLIENHVEPEKDAIPDLSLGFSNIDVHFEGDDFAWAVMDTTVGGTLASSGETLDRTGKQTVLFRKIDGDWRVVHTHSSSRARRR